MPYVRSQLQRLKVDDLRTICRELSISKVSKDAKATLITKILGVVTTPTNSECTESTADAPISPAPGDLNSAPTITKRSLSTGSHCQANPKQARLQESQSHPTTDHKNANDLRSMLSPANAELASTKSSGFYHPPTTTSASSGVPSVNITPSLPADPSSSGRLLHSRQTLKPNSKRHSAGPQFQMPVRVVKAVDHPKLRPPSLVASMSEFSDLEQIDSSLEARMRYIRSSFMEELFKNLKIHRQKIKNISSVTRKTTQQSGENLTFPGLHPDLYASPEPTQFAVSVRFWLFRLYINLQMGAGESWAANAYGVGILGPDLGRWPILVSCNRVTTDVWMVQTRQLENNTGPFLDMERDGREQCKKEKFLVLAVTGEVLGRSRPVALLGEGSDLTILEGCVVRADWVTYIQASQEVDSLSINSLIKTKNDHAYPGGVSRSWMKRTDNNTLSSIAARAAMCSCLPQSGVKASAVQMDAECLGNASGVATARINRKVEFYLPEALQVESVHIPKGPFNPALAMVHRQAGLSEYVLRETGQVVGEENLGVAELWQGILGCDSTGNYAVKPDFWSGWDRRIYSN